MKKFLFLFVVLVSGQLWSQKEAAIWYFGRYAGLDFNSGAPVALTDGALFTREGCASIADFNGNLLFYTDGITVWNRNHLPMPNGTGLLGDASSTQSGMIVPWPGNPNMYYVFTVDDAGEPEGLQYSLVDMTLDGGLGDITIKNAPLATPVTERLTAVQHANGTDIWVLAHGYGNNEFLAYRVTAAGVNTVPVVSAVGENYPILYNGEGTRGYMKVSPNGQFVATASYNSTELFRFDPATGVVSNPILLDDYFAPLHPLVSITYGVEFSSDSSKLYYGFTGFYGGISLDSSIHQFDMNVPYNQASILASGVEVAPIQSIEIGALQLGIDGKIYAANFGEAYMGVINNPNVKGVACNYVQNGVGLSGRTNRLGLPPFIQSFFVVGLQAENFCLGDGTEFSVTSSEPITSISWDFGDGNTSILENPTHTYATTGTYTVSATVITASDTKTETRDITIYEPPVANAPADLLGCTSYGNYNFDLTSFDTTVLGAQDPTVFSVAYFLSQADADNASNALASPYPFDYGTTTVYVRVSNSNNSQCYSTTQFNIIAREAPLIGTVTNWVVCDDDMDGTYSFDLSLKNPEIINGQDETKFELQYYGSQADADAAVNPLPNLYVNTLPNKEIFFRFQNNTYPTCFRTGSFHIQVLDGVVANTPTNLEICDDNNDGQATFDLTLAEPEIVGLQSPASLNISYHESQSDADMGTNAVTASSYLSLGYLTTIYVRVENVSDSSCYDTASFELHIFDTPVTPAISDWVVCDEDNDGYHNFDLTEKTDEILNGGTNLTVSYYLSDTDAQSGQNALPTDFTNTINPQTLYFRLENGRNAHCFGVGSFELEVFDIPTANPPSDMVFCDWDETGKYTFDLSQKDVEVLNGQDGAVYEVSYHASNLEAMNNENPLSKTAYGNSALNEVIWVRVQHAQLDFCYNVSSFNLIVNPLPELNLEETYVICPDSPDLVIDAGFFESYEWRDTQNNFIDSSQYLDVENLGEYSLTVTETTNGVVCSNTTFFEVVSSGAPDSMTIDINGFSDRIILTVNADGIGDFEYSLDGEIFQDDNIFEVFPGEYIIYVRDPFECRVLTENVFVVGYQKFFTPNGDDTNEYWNIIGAENYPSSLLTIYDRYGKLLGQVSPMSKGWDGSYLGNPMPASDYWFRFDTGEGEAVTGHFTLKR